MAKFIEVTDVGSKNLHYLNPDYIIKLEYSSEYSDAKTNIFYNGITKMEVLHVQEELNELLKDLN